MTDKPMTEQEIANNLYRPLKELYQQLDCINNEQLKGKEWIWHAVKYSGDLQKNIRQALESWEKHNGK